jgi:hypothetical protein
MSELVGADGKPLTVTAVRGSRRPPSPRRRSAVRSFNDYLVDRGAIDA